MRSRDAFDYDPHSVSSYDDAPNINGGESPYAHDKNVSRDAFDHSLDLKTVTEVYKKQFHSEKDVANDAASKLSSAAEDSLKAAHDSQAASTAFSHAIVPE